MTIMLAFVMTGCRGTAVVSEVKDVVLDPWENFDWDKFTQAVVWKESKGNVNAVGDSGKAVGPLQIWPIMVAEANRVSGSSFTLDDRLTVEGSVAIWNAVQDYHNPEHDPIRALKVWNKRHPDSYREDIFAYYESLFE